MTRFLVVILVSIGLCSFPTSGQVRVGLHGGWNFAKFLEPDRNIEGAPWTMQSHPLGGIALDIEASKHFMVAFQFNYTRRSYVAESYYEGAVLDGHTTTTLDYVEIPVFARWRMGEGSLRCFLEGGPAVAVVIRAVGRSEMFDNHVYNYEVGDFYRKTDLFLAIGAGGEYMLGGRFWLTLSAHYNMGLSETFINEYSRGSRSLALQCDMGVLFAL
jgi:hypothetical protein